MPRPQRCASILSGALPVVVDAGALDLAVGATGAADRHAARPRARAPARGARPRRPSDERIDERAAAARETAAALGAAVVLKGARTVVARPTAGRRAGRGRARRGSRRREPATCSPARSARWSRRRRLRRGSDGRTTSARSPRPARGCTAAPATLAAARVGAARRPDHRAGCRRGAAARGRRGCSRPPDAARGRGVRPARPPRMSRVSRRAVLWVAFAVVHVVVAVLGFVHAQPADGRRLPRLRAVVAEALDGSRDRRDHRDWVYPQLALVPMVLAQGLAWIAGYEVAWAILITALRRAGVRDAGRPRPLRRTDRGGAWFWLAFIALLGPIAHVPARRRSPCRSRSPAACGWSAGRGSPRPCWPSRRGSRSGRRRSSRRRVIAVRRRGAMIGGALLVSAATLVGGHRHGRRRAHAFGFVAGPDRPRAPARGAGERVLPVARGRAGSPGRSSTTTTTCSPSRSTGPEVDTVHRRDDAPARRRRRGDRRARRVQGLAGSELRRAVPAARR